MIKRMGVLAFIFSVWISMVIPGILIAQEVPSPPCAGCGGVPTTPKPFMVIPPSPLVSPTIPNGLEYDGTNLWLTDKTGNRGSVFSGNAPSTFNNTVTFGSTGVLDFQSGSVINFADGSVWKSTGLIFGSGTSLSFPDGSAWNSTGLTFGTGGTVKMPDGSLWKSSGLSNSNNILTSKTNIYTISHTITNSDCGGIVQMGTGTSGMLTVTLPAVFSINCAPITIYNGDSYTPGTSTGKILSGFPSQCFYILFPGQTCTVSISNGQWVATKYRTRFAITGMALYVNPAGSDTVNDCMSETNPCATINHTMTILYNHIDNQNSEPTIYLAATQAFPECVSVSGQLTGYNVGLITSTSGTGVSGGATWGNVTGSCPTGAIFSVLDGAEWQLSNILITNASGTTGIMGLHVHQAAVIDVLGGMAFGGNPGSEMIETDVGPSTINILGNIQINGGVTSNNFVLLGGENAFNICGSCTLTFASSPSITTLYQIEGAGTTINFGPGYTFTGAASITNACVVNGPSIVSMNGNTIPGTNVCTASGNLTHLGQAY